MSFLSQVSAKPAKTVILSMTAALLFQPATLSAQQAPQPSLGGWFTQDTLTGDWGGWRTKLEAAGITPSAHFETESAANPTGGIFPAARYAQQIDFGAIFDLGLLANLSGGKVQVVLTDRAGRSLSADAIGNLFPVQEVYGAGQDFRLAEMNYQQSLMDKHINFKLGWSPVGDDFATTPFACYFMNNGLCGKPPALAPDSGAHNFPVGQWGRQSERYARTLRRRRRLPSQSKRGRDPRGV